LLGPKISSATARINRISGKPNFPGIDRLRWDTRGALGRRLSLISKFRLVMGGSQRTVVGLQSSVSVAKTWLEVVVGLQSLAVSRWSLAKTSCRLQRPGRLSPCDCVARASTSKNRAWPLRPHLLNRSPTKY
jgi:hypothetical protein